MSTKLSHSPPSSPSNTNPAKKAKLDGVPNWLNPTGFIQSNAARGDASETSASDQKPQQRQKEGKGKSRKQKGLKLDPPEEVLLFDILAVTGWQELPKAIDGVYEIDPLYGKSKWPSQSPRDQVTAGEEDGDKAAKSWVFTKDTFHVTGLTSHGDGIAAYPSAPEVAQCAVIIPFTLPGDIVEAQITRHLQFHCFAEPLSIPTTNPSSSSSSISSPLPFDLTRDTSLIGCKYFGTCGGCQFQSIPYDQQLALKRHTLKKAMRNFSGLPLDQVPEIKATIPSPDQYGYRTKLTPHFQLPKALVRPRHNRKSRAPREVPEDVNVEDFPIGFEEKFRPRIIDVEECPIATPAINAQIPVMKEKVKKSIREYKNGATLLFRDSLVTGTEGEGSTGDKMEAEVVTAKVAPSLTASADVKMEMDEEEQMMNAEADGEVEIRPVTSRPASTKKGKGKLPELSLDVKVVDPEEHVCVTDHGKTATERVGDIVFQFPAGSFFQNNHSILVPLTSFVRDQIKHDPVVAGEETYLVDAYCGSGLFSLTLAGHFTKVCGIELDSASIHYATHNALINSLSNVTFHSGASEAIFQPIISELKWPGDKTTLIVDPPRKGCDEGFLRQVVKFGPKRVVYVSCNVHTMAANVGDLIRWSTESSSEGKGYKIISLGAIDLFPQTHHAEGLCVLEREC